MTDSELVERARAGDASAFGELVVLHGSAVYRAALAALGSPAEAEDVAQEALVQGFQKLAAFRGDSSFRTWVVAIAWRRALSRRRSLVRRWRLFVESGGEAREEPAVSAPSAEEAMLSSELQKDVRRLIRSLPARLRDPFLLAATGLHTHQELAVILGLPNGTLKWRLSEARRVLREKLTRLGYSR